MCKAVSSSRLQAKVQQAAARHSLTALRVLGQAIVQSTRVQCDVRQLGHMISATLCQVQNCQSVPVMLGVSHFQFLRRAEMQATRTTLSLCHFLTAYAFRLLAVESNTQLDRSVPVIAANMLSSAGQTLITNRRPFCSNVACSRQVHRLVVPQAAVPGR
jgi:hypothetical protein